MPIPEAAIDADGGPAPADLVCVADYPTAVEADDRGLVILAMGLSYWQMPEGGRHALFVERGTESAVHDQLTRYEREQANWPPAPLPPPAVSRRSLTPLGWALLVIAAFWAQQRWPAWTAFGSLDALALFTHGEWWRPATALFLHGDAGHLASNLAAGVFVFSAVIATLGRRQGWTLLALTAYGGNLASAALHAPEPYRSVGASTAVFAGLGLLTGYAIPAAWRARSGPGWRRILAPLGAGATLFALYGAGDARTDLGAHACGFFTGALVGLAAAFRARNGGRPSPSPGDA